MDLEQWCKDKYELAKKEYRWDDAENYRVLAELWAKRQGE